MSKNNNLTKMNTEEKYVYLHKVIYNAVNHSHTGKLLISTFYCRQTALILGGDYDKLTKLQKFLLKSDITSEYINIEKGINKYLEYK
jgi:hypothetical protein